MPAFRLASAPAARSSAVVARVARDGSRAAAPARAAASRRRAKVENSNLDAPLFYQLLLGEIELRDGQAGTAYQLMLDAANRAKDEQLFRRATEIALQARAGDQALAADAGLAPGAARFARRAALPDPVAGRPQSHRRGRRAARAAAAAHAAADAAGGDRGGAALPRPRHRPQRDRGAGRTRAAAVSSMRPTPRRRRWSRSAAPGSPPATRAKALDFARRASDADPAPKARAFLALDMLPATPAAEAIVKRQLAARADSPNVRLLYVRTLATSQRLAEAAAADRRC